MNIVIAIETETPLVELVEFGQDLNKLISNDKYKSIIDEVFVDE